MSLSKLTLTKLALTGLLVAGVVGSCAKDPVETILRDDLTLTTYFSEIKNGKSPRISIDIPFGVESILIEVRGSKGVYQLVEFITPGGRDLVEGSKITTRGAREIPGLVDWLFPNHPNVSLEEGTYKLTILADGDLSEDIEVLVYAPKKKTTCGLQLDFLVDDAALGIETFSAAVQRIEERVNVNFRQVGIKISNTTTLRVNMQSSDIDLGTGSALKIVDEVLERTANAGSSRENAVHVLLVRRIGGTESRTFDPAGYSMGLPGPYARDRGTSAVLVSTELYADNNGAFDADGLASSLAHEIGHYLGLYHTSEKGGETHDPLRDTPECESASSCTDEFKRNIMTSSFWLRGNRPSFRNFFSEEQGQIMRGHPLCEPTPVDILPPPIEDCTLECDAPTICAVLNAAMSCEEACIPDEADQCAIGECLFDELGAAICQDPR